MSTPAPPPAVRRTQPAPYRGPQPGTYGGPPLTGQPASRPPGPYGGRPTPPVPPRPVGPPPPPRPRRRRPSAFVGLVSLGIALVGIGLGAALDDPLGFPGSSATLGFLIALTGVSVVVLTLGHQGPGLRLQRLPRRGARPAARGRLGRLPGRDPGRRRRPHLGPRAGHRRRRPSSSVPATPPSTCAGSTRRRTATHAPQRVNVEMGAGDLTILVPKGLDTRVDASVGIGDITHRGGIERYHRHQRPRPQHAPPSSATSP